METLARYCDKRKRLQWTGMLSLQLISLNKPHICIEFYGKQQFISYQPHRHHCSASMFNVHWLHHSIEIDKDKDKDEDDDDDDDEDLIGMFRSFIANTIYDIKLFAHAKQYSKQHTPSIFYTCKAQQQTISIQFNS